MSSRADGRLSLGERCIALARAEMAAGVKAAPYGQPNTGPRVREYLAGCLRDLDKDGQVDLHERLNLTAGNWCMAFQSWLLEQTIAPGEVRPHLYRASCIEAVEDARKIGRWIPIADVRAGKRVPRPGDLAIWLRIEYVNGQAVPGTEWQRHVNRVVSYDSGDPLVTTDDRFVTIGGNESRTILETRDRPKRLTEGKLDGFIDFSQVVDGAAEPPPPPELDDMERERIQGLISRALYEIGTADERYRSDGGSGRKEA